MKIINTTILTAICISGLLLSAAAQPAGPPANDNNAAASPDQAPPPPPPGGPDMGPGGGPDAGPPPPMMAAPPDQTGTNEEDDTSADDTTATPAGNQPAAPAVISPSGSAPADEEPVASDFPAPAEATGTNTNPNDLTLNYRNAPLDMVLNYLSDAAGFIIVEDVPARGYITVKGTHLTKNEAVDLLNSELNKNNYAAICEGRTLTILNKNDAKTRNIPVKTGNIWTNIPNTAEIATWIIPIRFVDANQLVTELESFVSEQAIIVADPNGNSIIITDTQSNIRHLAQIIRMVDDSAEMETVVTTFPLKWASPIDVANELSSIFPSSTGTQSPVQLGGRGGRRGGGGGFGGAGGAGTTSQRIQKAQQIGVVPDSRTSAVVVTAPKDLMDEIAGVIADMDKPSTRDQQVYTYQLKNADPNQTLQTLNSMFGGNNSRGTTQTSALMNRNQSSANSAGTANVSTGIGTGATP
jgi:type II secretory pathway component GspD/PulD (secretin)